MKAVFLDRDGTLIVDPPDLRVDSIEKIELIPETLEALKELAKLDFMVFIITNQAGIAEGRMTKQQFEVINAKILERLSPSGVKIVQTYACPHSQEDHCVCRKPQPTMLQWAAEDFAIDLAASWMVGDRQTDVMAGKNAGTRTILVLTGNTQGESAEADFTAPTILEAIEYIRDHS